jgi:hypothetical protein
MPIPLDPPGAPAELRPQEDVDLLRADEPLAVFLVGGENELGGVLPSRGVG